MKTGMVLMDDLSRLFEEIEHLVMRHSPSGVEHEVDALILARFKQAGVSAHVDPAGNVVAKVSGQGKGRLAITAHKDEISATVTHVLEDGRLTVRNRVGGAFPWVYGEGVVDLLGESNSVSGILSFGSRHVSHASPQHLQKDTAPLKWADVWIETKLSRAELADAGVRPGTRMVIGKHRKRPFRLGEHIASYTLDNKASIAILLRLAERLKSPLPDVYLVASAKEEIGAIGALYFSQRHELDALVALEVCPIAPEYPVEDSSNPVLLVEDSHGIYDDRLNEQIRCAAGDIGVSLQFAALNGFGSDASEAMKLGHVPAAACLGFPTQNTHGFEIANLSSIRKCIDVLESLCAKSVGTPFR